MVGRGRGGVECCACVQANQPQISQYLSVCLSVQVAWNVIWSKLLLNPPLSLYVGVGAGLKELLAGAVRGFIETVGDYMRPAEDKDSHTPPEIVTPGYLTPESDVE